MACKCYHADKNFLGEIGVCWGTKECESCSCGGDAAKCDFYDYVRERVKKPITNADKIRQMSDEELADFITRQRFSVVNTLADKLGIDVTMAFIVGRKNVLDWLKQEVESDETNGART